MLGCTWLVVFSPLALIEPLTPPEYRVARRRKSSSTSSSAIHHVEAFQLYPLQTPPSCFSTRVLEPLENLDRGELRAEAAIGRQCTIFTFCSPKPRPEACGICRFRLEETTHSSEPVPKPAERTPRRSAAQ